MQAVFLLPYLGFALWFAGFALSGSVASIYKKIAKTRLLASTKKIAKTYLLCFFVAKAPPQPLLAGNGFAAWVHYGIC